MADNYLLFSEVTPQLSRTEYDWFQHQLQKIYVVQGKELSDMKGIDRKQIEWAGCRAFRDVDDYDPDFSDTTVGFDYECADTDEDRSLCTTMLFVVEVGNRQHLARVMRSLRRLPDVVKLGRARE